MDTDVYYVLHGFRIKDKTFEVIARVLFSFHSKVCPINDVVIRSCTNLMDRSVTCWILSSFLISENSSDLW